MPPQRQSDVIAVAALILLHLLWGSLLWMHADRFCVVDCPVEMLPRLIAIARSLQAGVVPFWDVHTFAGAKPLWMSMGGLYYPLLYPLYLLADTQDLSQASTLLQLLPYVLHLTWASLGGYFFGRRVVGLSSLGAVVLGLAFASSPTMLSVNLLNQAQGYSYLPWITLAAIRFLGTGSRRTWAAGALLVGGMCFSSNPDTVNRALFLVALQAGIYWWLVRWRGGWTRYDVGRFLALFPMVLLGMATFSFGYVGLYSGVSMALRALSLSCAEVATFAEYSTVHPPSLLGVFFPPVFASSVSELSNLETGALLLVAASFAFAASSRLSANQRHWARVGAGVVGLSIFVLLGSHSPVFAVLCRALPLFFGFPHPACYTVGVSWGLAILAGVGVSALTVNPTRRSLLLCAWPALAAALIVVVRPEIPFFRWQTDIASAPLYVIGIGLVLMIVGALPQRRRGVSLSLAVLLEILVSPFSLALNVPSSGAVHWMDHTTWTLPDNPTNELRRLLAPLAAADTARFVGTRSFIDNQAWVVNGRGLFGLMARPLFPAFQRAVLPFTTNAPNELWLVGLPHFLSNMNVGYVVGDREPTYHTFVAQDHAAFDAEVAALPLLDQTPRFDLRALPAPMPYIYTQDRIAIADSEEQFLKLQDSDLRAAAYLSEEVSAAHAQLKAAVRDSGGNEALAPMHFDELQAVNRITRIDRTDANRKHIDIDVHKAALLVVTEAWHAGWQARVDGTATPVWEVNYLQQGVWLEPGRHQLELYFRPNGLLYGIAASTAALVLISVLLIRGDRRPSIPVTG